MFNLGKKIKSKCSLAIIIVKIGMMDMSEKSVFSGLYFNGCDNALISAWFSEYYLDIITVDSFSRHNFVN